MYKKQVSDSEYEIMEYIWTKSAGTGIGELCKYLNKELGKTWKQQTVRAFLARLKTKGYIKTLIDSDTNRIIYLAVTSKEKYLQQESKRIVDKFFDGSINNFVMAFSGVENLSENQKEEIKKLIKK